LINQRRSTNCPKNDEYRNLQAPISKPAKFAKTKVAGWNAHDIWDNRIRRLRVDVGTASAQLTDAKRQNDLLRIVNLRKG
jgi:hypothetical protein